MSELTAAPAAEIETIKATYAAINRNDMPAAISAFDPELEWIDPPDLPGAGTHRGHAAVIAHTSKARHTWAEGACEPERFIAAGDKIVVFVHVRVRLKDHVDWIDACIADVFTFRHGRVIQVRTFVERPAALDWAGAKDAEAN